MPSRAATTEPAPTALWLPHPPARGQGGRSVIGYGVPAFFEFCSVLLVWFFCGGLAVAGVVPGIFPSLRAPWNPLGILFVGFIWLAMTFILITSVFLLSQAVTAAILARRSIDAPKAVTMSYIFVNVLPPGAAIIDPAVHTSTTEFWADIGDAVMAFRPRTLVPALLITLALALLAVSGDWHRQGVDLPVLYGIIVGLAAVGIPGIIWGVTRRMAQLQLQHARAARTLKRHQRQWAKLSPEEAAAEEASWMEWQ